MLKDNWVDKQDGIDDILAEDINSIANAVIETQEEINKIVIDQTYSPGSENAQSGKAVAEAVSDKQDSLVSGTNIKTINNQSILGSGNITIEGGSDVEVDQIFDPESENAQSGKAVEEAVTTEQKRSDNTFANALKGNKSDTAILLDDVSPVAHEMGVKVRGKNLFDKSIPYEDYTYHVGGYRFLSIYVGSGSSVTVSLKQKHDIGLGGYFYCIAYKSGVPGASQEWLYYNSNTYLCVKSVTMISEDGYISLFMTSEAYNSFKDEIMVEIGTTATAYTPYVPDLTAVKVSRCGKNLLPYPYVETTLTRNGITFTDNGDGTITANGTATDVVFFVLNPKLTLPKGTYCVSDSLNRDDAYVRFSLYKGSFTIDETTESCETRVDNGATLNNVLFKPQLELGTTATDYEPYISPTDYTPNADGTVEGVTSLYPNTTLTTDTEGVLIDCEYNRDINKAFAALEAAIATNNS